MKTKTNNNFRFDGLSGSSLADSGSHVFALSSAQQSALLAGSLQSPQLPASSDNIQT